MTGAVAAGLLLCASGVPTMRPYIWRLVEENYISWCWSRLSDVVRGSLGAHAASLQRFLEQTWLDSAFSAKGKLARVWRVGCARIEAGIASRPPAVFAIKVGTYAAVNVPAIMLLQAKCGSNHLQRFFSLHMKISSSQPPHKDPTENCEDASFPGCQFAFDPKWVGEWVSAWNVCRAQGKRKQENTSFNGRVALHMFAFFYQSRKQGILMSHPHPPDATIQSPKCGHEFRKRVDPWHFEPSSTQCWQQCHKVFHKASKATAGCIPIRWPPCQAFQHSTGVGSKFQVSAECLTENLAHHGIESELPWITMFFTQLMGPKRDRSLFHPISCQRLALIKRGQSLAIWRHANKANDGFLRSEGCWQQTLTATQWAGGTCCSQWSGECRSASLVSNLALCTKQFFCKSLALKTGYPDSASCGTVVLVDLYHTDF